MQAGADEDKPQIRYVVQRLETTLLSYDIYGATSAKEALAIFDKLAEGGKEPEPSEECLGTEPYGVVRPDGVLELEELIFEDK